MKRATTLSLITIALLFSACGHRKNLSPMPSIPDEAKASMNKPVNCATAKEDIKMLEDEKASVAKQAIAGIRSVVPFAAAGGILLGDYQDRVAVATGEYNADLQAKIDQIRGECGITEAIAE